MRIKLADLKLAIEQVPVGVEAVELQVRDTVELEFYEGAAKAYATVIIHPASQSTTPDIRRTAKLYKKV